ncbi:pyridoxine 5'-phosphate synthase [bacterium]|nr:pyridoxine 5'-phosphate synthase [bacterium]MCP5463288.1 pyridoxine 5'-phosphate synthase [bacterium]
MITLGVNIDHIATIREARKTYEPDPIWAAAIAELAGADCITIHLREDRRHIQDRDLELLKKTVQTKLNLEMANYPDIISSACSIKPHQATIVPERRSEVTTEGGIDVAKNLKSLTQTIAQLKEAGITTSLFIEPDKIQISAAAQTKTDFIELHTGKYANTQNESEAKKELDRLFSASSYAHSLNLRVNAGHGLTMKNVIPLCAMPYLEELNIGHHIISRAVFIGLRQAVIEMKQLLEKYS